MPRISHGFKMGRGMMKRSDAVWTCEGTMRFMGGSVAIRMVILGYKTTPSQSSLDLVVYSPFPAAEVAEAVSALGAVRFIVAPNTMHHVWAGEFKAAFPDAVLIAPAGLAAKLPGVAFDVLLGAEEGTGTGDSSALADRASSAGAKPSTAATSLPISWPANQLTLKVIPGFKSEEIVALHKPSKTLVVADLAFNFDRSSDDDEVPLPPPPISWYMALAGGYRRCCVTKPLAFLFTDATRVRAALDEVLEAWDWDAIIMCHGSAITAGAKQALREGTYEFVCGLEERRAARSAGLFFRRRQAARKGDAGGGEGKGGMLSSEVLPWVAGGAAVAAAALAAVALRASR